MNYIKIFAITVKELRSHILLMGFSLAGSLIVTLFFSNRNSLDFTDNKLMIDINYAFTLGVFLYMLVFGSLMASEKREEKHKGYSFLKLLPVNMSEIILGKYLAVFINVIIGVSFLTIISQLIYRPYEIANFTQAYIFIASSISIILVGLLYIIAIRKDYSSYLLLVLILYISAMILPNVTSILLLISGKEQMYFDIIRKISGSGFPFHLVISTVVFWLLAFCAIRFQTRRQVSCIGE